MKQDVSSLLLIGYTMAAIAALSSPSALVAAGGLNILGGELQPCSHNGMALTGFTRTGFCEDYDEDTGSHNICIDIPSSKEATSVPSRVNQIGVRNQPSVMKTKTSSVVKSNIGAFVSGPFRAIWTTLEAVIRLLTLSVRAPIKKSSCTTKRRSTKRTMKLPKWHSCAWRNDVEN